MNKKNNDMKTTFRLTAFFAAILLLVSCTEKSNEPVIIKQERDIFYAVAENATLSVLSGNGTTTHLTTDDQWESLLDHFCDYAQGGEQVMFCNTHTGSQSLAKGTITDTPTSITTSDREELKAWMKAMETAGKTVIVTYNEGNGTWNGRAYANLGAQASESEAQDYSGILTFIPTPVMDNPPLGGMVMALQVSESNTYIITMHGMMMWFDTDTSNDTMELLQGTQTSLTGVALTHTDLNGDTFYSVELLVTEQGIIGF